MTRFAFIDREKAFYDVTVLCQLLKVSRSGFCAWLSRPPSTRAVADQVLTEQIRTAFNDNRKIYSAPRIHDELSDAGPVCDRCYQAALPTRHLHRLPRQPAARVPTRTRRDPVR